MGALFFPAMGRPHPGDALADPTGLLTLVVRLLLAVVALVFRVPPIPDFRFPNALRIAFIVSVLCFAVRRSLA